MSAKDTKLALINAVHSLDAVDKAVFASSTLSTGKSLWDQGGVCAIVQSFKSARDGDKLSGPPPVRPSNFLLRSRSLRRRRFVLSTS